VRPAVALALAVLAACRTDDPPAPAANETIVEPTTRAATAVERTENERSGYVGVLTAKDLAEVIAPFTSNVSRLDVKLGDRVEAKQVLALLDDRPLREALAIAEATLRTSRTEVAQADVARKAAKSTADREQKAYDAGISSQALLTGAKFDLQKAEMAVARASAAAGEEKAKIDQLKAKLIDTSLLSPIAGRVALIYVTTGARVEEGHPVIRVISSDDLFVKFAIPADKRGTLAPNDEVEIRIEEQNISYKGVVRHVAPELDPVAQMILADAELVDPPGGLQSGIVCRIVPKKR
jgi:RND family efflux transporter MFP subunit